MQWRLGPLNRSFEKTEVDKFLGNLPKNISRSQKAVIRKAYLLAEDAHKFQKRLSGEPYIIHPLAVAMSIAEILPDHEVIAAALLHDVLEDTPISRETLLSDFGETITHLVDGVTKISLLKNQSSENQAHSIRKMIIATIIDMRVTLIKLVDKMHNMHTLSYHKPEKQKKISQEVIDIYAPLAGRMGIYKIKAELEDLALYYLHNKIYNQIKKEISEKKNQREERIRVVASILHSRLKESKIKAEIRGRSKHFYSIYRKMIEQKKSVSEIYDLSGIRALCESIQDCYGILGLVHSLWNPIPGRFKDYISVPKSNGYQSLHTTVIGPDGKSIEIQIRTYTMHDISEYGIAAHWAYKEKDNQFAGQSNLIKNLSEHIEESNTAREFIENLKNNLKENDEVYVFSPKGEIFSMAKGSTVLDFAFRIHTDLGLQCAGAKINDRLISIRTPLKSGDQLQIITSSNVKPSLNWINILQTSHAKAKLKAWFRKNGGLPTAEQAIHGINVEDKISLAKDFLPEPEALKRKKKITQEDLKKKILWDGISDMKVRFAECCSPGFGEKIVGFITKGQGISVHKKECPSILQLLAKTENSGRIVALKWKGEPILTAELFVSGLDRAELFLDIVSALARSGADILKANASINSAGKVQDTFLVEIDSALHLDTIRKLLLKINGVMDVNSKIQNKMQMKAHKKK